MDSVSDLALRVVKATLERERLVKAVDARAEAVRLGEIRLGSVQKAQALIQKTAQETQSQLKYHVESLVQNAIDAVFPTSYIFKMDFVLRRNQTEVDIWLDMEGEQVDPMDAAGGGVVDVVSFALRVVAWSLSSTSPILLLDEPMKWVSAGRRKVCGELIQEVASKLGLQILMVTHDPDLVERADRVFRFEQKRRRTQVTISEGTKA